MMKRPFSPASELLEFADVFQHHVKRSRRLSSVSDDDNTSLDIDSVMADLRFMSHWLPLSNLQAVDYPLDPSCMGSVQLNWQNIIPGCTAVLHEPDSPELLVLEALYSSSDVAVDAPATRSSVADNHAHVSPVLDMVFPFNHPTCASPSFDDMDNEPSEHRWTNVYSTPKRSLSVSSAISCDSAITTRSSTPESDTDSAIGTPESRPTLSSRTFNTDAPASEMFSFGALKRLNASIRATKGVRLTL